MGRFNNWSPPWRDPYYPLEQPIPHAGADFPTADIVYGTNEEEALAEVKNLFSEDNNMDCCVILGWSEEEVLPYSLSRGHTSTIDPSGHQQPCEPRVYVTRTTTKAQALADHLVENPVDDEYQPLSTYFPDEEVNSVEAISEDTNAWKMFFDGAGEWETRDVKLIPYRQHVEDLSKRFKSIEFRYISRCHNELDDALATLASMLLYPGNAHIDPLEIQIRERHGYCNTVEAEPNIQPWSFSVVSGVQEIGWVECGIVFAYMGLL
ncbi:PREDICTED: uncharacterized protein LOC109214740 [Nicotiana attenuata]|uniref:uncharacterized protein LOC109214740 n=1 Tax=Nicotiana attenuata TaxID=49451 RepID=UPI000904D2DD|nr:PREDICTED: uncharacterized protein LOC109214740 [Nicotiana attenuata]